MANQPTNTRRAAAEDFRIAQARKSLARAKAAVDDLSQPYNPAEDAGRLQVAVELLLDYIAEMDR